MTQLVQSVTTAATTLNKAYRKMQGGLLKGFQSMSEEWDLFDDIADYEIYLWEVGSPFEKAVRLTYHSGNDRWPDIFVPGEQ